MTKRRFLYTLLTILGAHAAMAQSLATISKDVECGQMIYRNATTVTVNLVNRGTQPVQITNVDTGCGCTVANYAAGDIQPGETGQLRLTFDCKQLGHFSRYVRVYDTSSETPAEFFVNGQVVAKQESYSGEYPYKMGVLLADTNSIEFDDVHRGQRLVKEIHIINATGKNANPVLLRLPAYLQADMMPAQLGPKQKGVMRVTLKSKELREGDYGLIQSSVYLGSDPADKVTPEKEIAVSMIVLPKLENSDEISRSVAPHLTLSKTKIDLSALKEKSKARDEITLTNSGRAVLEIRKLQMFTTGLEVSLDKSRLEPGQTATLKVSASKKQLKKVRRHPRVLMITNDPSQQKIVLDVDGVK